MLHAVLSIVYLNCIYRLEGLAVSSTVYCRRSSILLCSFPLPKIMVEALSLPSSVSEKKTVYTFIHTQHRNEHKSEVDRHLAISHRNVY